MNAIRSRPFSHRLRALPRQLPELAELRRVVGALESRRTRAMARRALVEVAELVATISLHLPRRTKRQRDFDRDAFDPILVAIANATGHCPSCDTRVASWAVPTGRSAFVPCASHRTGGAS